MNYLTIRCVYKVLDLVMDHRTNLALTVGVILGFLVGMTPVMTLQWLLLFLMLLVVRVNLAAAILSTLFFGLLSYPLSDVFDKLGLWLLAGVPALQPTWAKLYQAPIFPFTQFNHSRVMGSFVFCVILSPLLGLAAYKLLSSFRVDVYEAFRATRLYRTYTHYRKYLR